MDIPLRLFDLLPQAFVGRESTVRAELRSLRPEDIDASSVVEFNPATHMRIAIIYDREDLGYSINTYLCRKEGFADKVAATKSFIRAKTLEENDGRDPILQIARRVITYHTGAIAGLLGILSVEVDEARDTETLLAMVAHTAGILYGPFTDLCLSIALPGYAPGTTSQDGWSYLTKKIYVV